MGRKGDSGWGGGGGWYLFELDFERGSLIFDRRFYVD